MKEWKGDASWIYRSFLAIRKHVQKGLCWLIGNGNQVRIWADPWVSEIEGFSPTRNQNYEAEEEIEWVSELIDPIRREWKEDEVRFCFDTQSAELVLKIPISSHPHEDKLVWASNVKGIFTVRSCYHLIRHQTTNNAPGWEPHMWDKLWKCQVPERYRHFLWRTACSLLPTRQRIQMIFQIADSATTCVLCDKYKENAVHLFFECEFAREVWLTSQWGSKIANFAGSSIIKWLEILIDPTSTLDIDNETGEKLQKFGIGLMEKIWAHRNEIIRGSPKMKAVTMLKLAQQGANSLIEIKDCFEIRQREMSLVIPTRFTDNFVILEGDVAVRQNFSVIAVVARSTSGKLLAIVTQKLSGTSVLKGELSACRLALLLADKNCWRNIVVRSDSLYSVEALGEQQDCHDWHFIPIVHDCKCLMAKASSCTIEKINRVSNSWAHSTARWAASNLWVGCIPYHFIPLIERCLVNGLDPPINLGNPNGSIDG